MSEDKLDIINLKHVTVCKGSKLNNNMRNIIALYASIL